MGNGLTFLLQLSHLQHGDNNSTLPYTTCGGDQWLSPWAPTAGYPFCAPLPHNMDRKWPKPVTFSFARNCWGGRAQDAIL